MSCARYEKSARLGAAFLELPLRVRQHCRQKVPFGASLKKDRKCYFLDLFSGKGGMSRSFRKLGFRCYEYDIVHGPEFDLTQQSLLHRLARNIARGKVLRATLAPPCSSFSVARDRAAV